MYTNILGYKVFNETKENFLREIDKRDKTIVISGNPEILYNGLENEKLRNSRVKNWLFIRLNACT